MMWLNRRCHLSFSARTQAFKYIVLLLNSFSVSELAGKLILSCLLAHNRHLPQEPTANGSVLYYDFLQLQDVRIWL